MHEGFVIVGKKKREAYPDEKAFNGEVYGLSSVGTALQKGSSVYARKERIAMGN